jgi:transketolase
MPSWNLFDALQQAERDAVLPPSVPARLAVEAAATLGWHRYVGDAGVVIGVDRFGASVPGETVLRKYGFYRRQRLRAREGIAAPYIVRMTTTSQST